MTWQQSAQTIELKRHLPSSLIIGAKNNGSRQSAKLTQFPVVLAYAITDYKCQRDTYHHGVRIDLMKPLSGGSLHASAYVQLSRVKRLNQISILRSFNSEDLK